MNWWSCWFFRLCWFSVDFSAKIGVVKSLWSGENRINTGFSKIYGLFFQIINSIFSFRGVRGCSGSYYCEKIQQIQGFSICRAVNRLLWLAVPARSGVNGFILGRVDFLLIFPLHQHQPGTAHTSGNRYPPEGDIYPAQSAEGVVRIPSSNKRFLERGYSLIYSTISTKNK